jgi:hypothetical protein
LHIGQYQVLLVGAADLTKGVLVSQVGNQLQLLISDIAGGETGGLERDIDDAIARYPVIIGIALDPVAENQVFESLLFQLRIGSNAIQFLVLGVGEE